LKILQATRLPLQIHFRQARPLSSSPTCGQNVVAGIGDAGIPGERIFAKNLFEKKK
jgi:hypothetical protein